MEPRFRCRIAGSRWLLKKWKIGTTISMLPRQEHARGYPGTQYIESGLREIEVCFGSRANQALESRPCYGMLWITQIKDAI